MKRLLLMLSAFLLVPGMIGCEADGGPGKREQASIKILYYDEAAYYSNYGALFAAQYSNIDVEVISTEGIRVEDMDKLIREQKPDVLILDAGQYEAYAKDGLLYELDPLIKKDKFDLQAVAPSITDSVKTMGGGKLYGLAPNFASQALYYNKSLFDQMGIPYPTDKMSWEEVLQLARRFPSGSGDPDKRVAGLMLNTYDVHPYPSGLTIGYGQGLSYLDAETMKMTLDTSEWKRTFQLTFDAIKSGAIYQPAGTSSFTPGMGRQQVLEQNPFLGGKAAMTVSSNDFVQELRRAANVLKERMPQWDIVTVPVDAKNPDTGNALWLQDITAIYSGSADVEAAWTFVRYINGDSFARVMAKAATGGKMTSRTAYLKEDQGRNMDAFHALKLNPNTPRGTGKVPQTFYFSFEALAKQEITAAYEGRKTIDEALKVLQQKGQELLGKKEG